MWWWWQLQNSRSKIVEVSNRLAFYQVVKYRKKNVYKIPINLPFKIHTVCSTQSLQKSVQKNNTKLGAIYRYVLSQSLHEIRGKSKYEKLTFVSHSSEIRGLKDSVKHIVGNTWCGALLCIYLQNCTSIVQHWDNDFFIP